MWNPTDVPSLQFLAPPGGASVEGIYQVRYQATDQYGGTTMDFFYTTVDGDYSMLAVGVDYVFDLEEWKILLGGGLFNASADVTGTIGGTPVKSDASVTGLIFDVRADYTFENQVFVGVGLNLGFGTASGTETESADSASGSIFALYIPVGFTF